jgi:hypothetical protein
LNLGFLFSSSLQLDALVRREILALSAGKGVYKPFLGRLFLLPYNHKLFCLAPKHIVHPPNDSAWVSWHLRLLSQTTKTRAQKQDEPDSLAKRLKNESNIKLIVV